MWPHVAGRRALPGRAARSPSAPTPTSRPRRARFYGLLPASISHEGYSAKPMHSYWDDFWALKGYDGAVDIADGARRRRARPRRIRRERDEFRARPRARRCAPALPRTASTTSPARPSSAISIRRRRRSRSRPAATPARCRRACCTRRSSATGSEFVERRDGRKRVGGLHAVRAAHRRHVRAARLARPRARAARLLPRRPAARGVEPVGRGRRPRPARAALRRRHAARLGRVRLHPRRRSTCSPTSATPTTRWCSPPAFRASWLDDGGIAVTGLRTPYGTLSYSLRQRRRSRDHCRSTPGSRLPPGRHRPRVAGRRAPGSATINGKPAPWRRQRAAHRELPASVVIDAR